MTEITPELLLRAYAEGIFPMAEDRHDTTLYWVDPDARGVIPLDTFHVPRRLARKLKREEFEFRLDSDFTQVVEHCAAPARGRHTTWISDQIIELYSALHEGGFAHSVECWKDGQMVGGLYGVSLGAGFFGESMFSLETDASKAALVYLVAHLKRRGFRLLDTQFITDHLRQFGAIEIPRSEYRVLLNEAIHSAGSINISFSSEGSIMSGATLLQSISHTS